MAQTNATILIPDASGFTRFMTITEDTHSLHVILNAVGEEYEISEIEGNAVLMFKKGQALSKRKIGHLP